MRVSILGTRGAKLLSIRRNSPRVERLEDRTAPSVVPVGGEFRVNTTTIGSQVIGSVAMDQAGDSIVVWSSPDAAGNDTGVFAQRYNSAGQLQGGEFRVSTDLANTSVGVMSVAMDPSGDSVVVWDRALNSNGIGDIYAQRYNSDGVAQGGEFLVNTFTTNRQFDPSIAMDQAGDFVIAWTSYTQDGSENGVYAQLYNLSGLPLGGEFRVNAYTTAGQAEPSVAMDQIGDFAVAWSSYVQDGSSYGVYARRYSASGVPLGGEFLVNTGTVGSQANPSLAMNAGGGFVIAWSNDFADGSSVGISAQCYLAGGLPQGAEFRVNTFTTNQQYGPSVAVDQAGDFVVAWQSRDQDGSQLGIYAQAFQADGTPDGGEFRVNTHTNGVQTTPAVAMDPTGEFVVIWNDYGLDGSRYGVYEQRYKLTEPPRVSDTQINDGTAQHSRVTSLAVSFSSQINFATTPAAAFTLTRNADGAAVGFTATPSVVGGVTVVTLNNFSGLATQSGSLADGRYTLTALASQISANGQQMAVNYTFGDAQGLFRYYGDMNGDRRVDISDFGFFSLAYLTPANYNPALDFNNDGRIDIADFGQFSVRFFTTLP